MPRRPKLVTQYLENIHRDAFEDHADLIRELTRHRSGIYALYRKGRLYYVGLARDLRWRVRHHIRDKHQGKWDRFSVYLTIGDHHLRELESLAIRIMQPKGNSQKGRFAGADNLTRVFRRALVEKFRRESDRLLGRILKQAAERPALKRTRRIRGRHKGVLYRARWRRDDTVRFRGKLYPSLTAVATTICGRHVSGRWFWTMERSPGDWVRIREL